MSTADFLIGQMLGEGDTDPVFFDPDQRSPARSPNICEPGTTHVLSYPLLGLSGGDKSLLYQFGGTQDVLYPFNTGYENPRPELNSVTDTSSSPSTIDSQTAPSSAFHENNPEEPKRKITRPKTKTSTKTPEQKSPARPTPKSRRQPRRDATKASDTLLEDQEPEPVPTKKKTKNRRQRSLERNRVAASKCRKRKKQWTDGLEQKQSGLESRHHELQAEYMRLLQESSQLKNFLINHASCQDPNIDIWIKNEASKFVQNLQKTRRLNSLLSVPSLDGTGSISSSASPLTGAALESPDFESRELDMADYPDEDQPSGDDLED